jgi:two-component system catabolic regulation response regulator CreB
MTKPLALIIEDDLEIAKILALSLKNEFEVEILTDGNSAVTRLAQAVPALIMLDLHLPEVSGMDIFARIRSVKHARELEWRCRVRLICSTETHQSQPLH